MIDAVSNEVLGILDEVLYSPSFIEPYSSTQYHLNTSGHGNRSIKLKLKIYDNINANYSLVDKFADTEILPKSVVKEISINKGIDVTEYDLFQNYPNPFNPSTTIRYQIPQDGLVILKVYDILGREVKTLINDFKTKGRYAVTFDASSLASGLYIYEITSGSFKASKKMSLIK